MPDLNLISGNHKKEDAETHICNLSTPVEDGRQREKSWLA